MKAVSYLHHLTVTFILIFSWAISFGQYADPGIYTIDENEIEREYGERLDSEIDPQSIDMHLLQGAAWLAANKARKKAKAPFLSFESLLFQAAKSHACNMAEDGFFSHTDKKNKQSRTLEDRMELVGFEGSRFSENIAKIYIDPYEPGTYRDFGQRLINEWLGSYGHKQILLDKDLTRAGLALCFEAKPDKYGYYYVLAVHNFGRLWED